MNGGNALKDLLDREPNGEDDGQQQLQKDLKINK
jgi:hypothetical protein